MFPNKRFLSLVFTAMFAVCTVVVNAQSEDEFIDYGESEEELVVTAGRVSEETKNTPAQITVISADDIAQSGAASVVDVLETVAGVRFSGAMSGAGSESISMRGFGEGSYGRVLVLVDGNKINNPDMNAANWNAIPLSAIDRIEVLDGSAGVLYGNNAVGGVINVITKKGGARQTSVDLAGGSFFYNREALSHFQPLSWGNFSVSAEHSSSNGYRDRQASRNVNLSGASSIFIGSAMRLSLNGFFSWLTFELPGGLTKEQFNDDPKQAVNKNDGNKEYHFGGGLSFSWFPAENIELMLPLSYRGKSAAIDMASYQYGGGYTDKSVHSAEARPQASVTFDIAGMPLRLLGGADFYYARLDADIYDDENRAINSNGFIISEWTIGPYMTARFSPLDNLSFSAGGRFDTAIIKAEKDDGLIDNNKTYRVFIYDAGLVYNPLDELKIYTRYEALFRYPFVDELAEVYGGSFNEDLEPEKGFNAEIGTAWKFADFLNMSANFFFMQMEDEISYSMDTFANENLDKTRRIGANIGLNLTPFKWISLDGSYSFVNAVFTNGVNADKQVPLVPEHKIYGNLMFHVPFGLSFGPDIEYLSNCHYSGDAANTEDTMDDHFLLGARLRFVLDKSKHHFAFQVTGKNLLDAEYETYGNTWAHYPADGRSINISVNYRF